jgi:hypothetical protein
VGRGGDLLRDPDPEGGAPGGLPRESVLLVGCWRHIAHAGDVDTEHTDGVPIGPHHAAAPLTPEPG